MHGSFCPTPVLPTLVGGPEDVTVRYGHPTEFTCKFINGNDDFSIIWKINDILQDCDVWCYKTSTHGVLQLKFTASLSVGNHSIQCILKQNIPKYLVADSSFEDDVNEDVIRDATLTLTEPGKLEP